MKFFYDLKKYKLNPYNIKPQFKPYWMNTCTTSVLVNFAKESIRKENSNKVFEKLLSISMD